MKRFLMLLVILTCTLPMTTFAAPLILPQTGQTVCYDASGNTINCQNTLQDGNLKAGMAWPDPRFVDNQNGTVVDKLSNLVWTKNADAPEAGACSVQLAMSWQQALDYVACLNSSNYLGVNDWVLPNVNQMQSLINYGQSNNVTWLTEIPGTKPGFTDVQNAGYWTSDTYVADPSMAWAVAIGGAGQVQDNKIADQNHVWPVRNAPDLVVTYIGVPTTLVTGQTMTIPVTVRNIGMKSIITTNSYASLHFSTDSIITTSDAHLNLSNPISPLAPGEEQTFNITFTVPQTTTGVHYFGVIVDRYNCVLESDETNNILAVPATTVGYGPDLVVTNMDAPTTLATGQTVTIPVTVRNIGIGAKINTGSWLSVHFSTDSIITTSDVSLQYTNGLGDFAPGEERTFNLTITVPQVATGEYYFGAIVDRYNGVFESDETNNVLAADNPTQIN